MKSASSAVPKLTGMLIILALAFLPLHSQTQMQPPSIRIEVEPENFDARDTLKVIVRVSLEQGWHINSTQPENEFAIATSLELKGKGLAFSSAEFPEPLKKSVKLFNQDLSIYEGDFEINSSVWQSSPEADLNSLQAILHYQACSDSICLRPASVTGYLKPQYASSKGELQDFSQTTGTGKTSPGESSTEKFGGPWFIVVLILLGGGLALNLTPCVYPLIAITISLFGGQGRRSFGSRLIMSLLYVLGIVLSFSALGVLSAFSGSLFGSTLQSPAVQILIAGIFITLALSSFGLFEIRLPYSLMGKAAAASNTGGYLGGLLGGLFAGVLASPCIGPFILALILYVAEKGELYTGFWMFATLALGMGAPYLVLGVSTGLVQKMPKSGEWMSDVKKILGIVLLALANYYLRGITGETAYLIVFGLLLIYAAMYINPFTGKPGVSIWLGAVIRTAALITLVWGATYLLKAVKVNNLFSTTQRSQTVSAALDWKEYSNVLLAQAKMRGQPILIDFESKIWCAACREMEEKTYSNSEVQKLLKDYLLLKVDVDHHPQKDRLIEEYRILGVPTVIILNTRGEEKDRITGFLGPEKFITRVHQSSKGTI
jgi:thiol:disulfide interchange protein DsbD